MGKCGPGRAQSGREGEIFGIRRVNEIVAEEEEELERVSRAEKIVENSGGKPANSLTLGREHQGCS